MFLGYVFLGFALGSFKSVSFSFAADHLPLSVQGMGFSFYNAVRALGWGLAGFAIGGPTADLLITTGRPVVEAYVLVLYLSGFLTIVSAGIMFRLARSDESSPVFPIPSCP